MHFGRLDHKNNCQRSRMNMLVTKASASTFPAALSRGFPDGCGWAIMNEFSIWSLSMGRPYSADLRALVIRMWRRHVGTCGSGSLPAP